MNNTLSGNTRYGYSDLGLNPIEEVFERGFGFPNDPRGSRNEGRTAPESRESLGRGRYMPYRKNRLSNQERFPQRQAPSMSETKSYVYKGRVPAARSTVGDGELRTLAYGHDALGSIRAVVSHGTVQEQYDYDAFGKPFGSELETDERGYNGKPYDAVLGHYNYGYRDYDPLTRRFATVDPIRDGRNWYVYTANDPISRIDPNGLADLVAQEGMPVFVVEDGDNLWNMINDQNPNAADVEIISKVNEISELNNLCDPNMIMPGQELIAPERVVPDITDDLYDKMRTNAQDWKTINPFYFKERVQAGGDWDLKAQDGTAYDTTPLQYSEYYFNSEIVRYDAPGNIHYGYVGSSTWYGSEKRLMKRAGYERLKIIQEQIGLVTTQWTPTTFK